MSARDTVWISAAELARRLEAGEPLTLLDVRWSLAAPDGRAAYEQGHLPGAVYVSLEGELSDHTVEDLGRHPLPTGSAIEAAARRWGVRAGRPVVAYDDWNRAGSSRAWWVLTAAGIHDVRILDGGLAGWTAAGGRLESGVVAPSPGDVTVAHDDLYAGARRTVTADALLEPGRLVLDARAPERFRGEVEPVDPVAGHIPGALNVPSTSLLADDGTLLADDQLARTFGHVGGGEAAVYCGSGVTAAVTIAGLAALGVDAALFPGSWSQWSSDPSRPVARGSRP